MDVCMVCSPCPALASLFSSVSWDANSLEETTVLYCICVCCIFTYWWTHVQDCWLCCFSIKWIQYHCSHCRGINHKQGTRRGNSLHCQCAVNYIQYLTASLMTPFLMCSLCTVNYLCMFFVPDFRRLFRVPGTGTITRNGAIPGEEAVLSEFAVATTGLQTSRAVWLG